MDLAGYYDDPEPTGPTEEEEDAALRSFGLDPEEVGKRMQEVADDALKAYKHKCAQCGAMFANCDYVNASDKLCAECEVIFYEENPFNGPTDEELRQQRMQLVDGYPGEWRRVDTSSRWPVWEVNVSEQIVAYARETPYCYDGGIYVAQGEERVKILSLWISGDGWYEVARKLKPKAEALKVCLKGMRDD